MPGLIRVFIELKFMIMKTLKYLLMGILLFTILPFCNSQSQIKTKQVVTLQSVLPDAPGKLLSESKEILLRRLACMNLRDVRVTQNSEMSGLVVTVGDTIAREDLSELLLSRGELNLYCISSASDTLNEEDILEAHADIQHPELPALCITLKEKVWKSWEETTARHMNEPMAFVVDGKIIASPQIRDKISHGKISLTGSGFSKTEVRKLAAIISGGALPLKFTVLSNN
jgi:preprotein translocase subunit SecD